MNNAYQTTKLTIKGQRSIISLHRSRVELIDSRNTNHKVSFLMNLDVLRCSS